MALEYPKAFELIAAKVEEEKAKREKYAKMLADVRERLSQM